MPLVLFDLDGTLVDSAPDLCASLNRIRRSENLVEDRFDGSVFHIDRDSAVDVDDVVGIKENVFGFFLDLCEHLFYGFIFGVDR